MEAAMRSGKYPPIQSSRFSVLWGWIIIDDAQE